MAGEVTNKVMALSDVNHKLKCEVSKSLSKKGGGGEWRVPTARTPPRKAAGGKIRQGAI